MAAAVILNFAQTAITRPPIAVPRTDLPLY